MNLQRLKNKIHQFSNSSDFQNAFEQLKADIREAVNTEEPGENKPYYTNHVARELFQKAADFGLNHLIEGEVDAGFRPVSGDTTFLGSAVTSLATPTLVISTDSDTMQVTLTSTTVTDASTYQFQVSSSSDFSSPTNIQNTSSTTATYTVTSVGTFYFRLRACGADNSRSNWTATQNTSSEEWTLSSVTSSKAWYDATSGVQVSGTDITQWNDKSGNGYHLTPKSPSTGTNNHTLVSTGLNNLDVVRHDTDDYYSESIGSMSGDITFAMLCKVNSAGLNSSDSIFSVAGQHPSFQLQAGVSNQFRAHLTGTGLGSDASNTTDYADAWHIFLLKLDLTDAFGKIFVDGSQSGSSVSFTNDLGATSLRIWANRGNTFQPSGDIAEFVVVQDSSDSIQEKIEGYLSHKWGLADNLPSDHTYKSSAPIRFTS